MNAKQLSFCALFFLISSFSIAQNTWTSSGSHMYYTKGNIGIGTTSPTAKLHVDGRLETKELVVSGEMGRYLGDKLTFNNIKMGHYALSWLRDTSLATDGDSFWLSSWGGIRMFTLGKSRVIIDKNGRVGIGVEKPTHELTVNGTILAEEIIVRSDWADFVFEKDYKLLTLEEVETHINENGHLPGIPSAAEVKENGVGLSEMNVKLLQKIEEQTLYILELNRQLQEIKAQLPSNVK